MRDLFNLNPTVVRMVSDFGYIYKFCSDPGFLKGFLNQK